MVSDKLEILSYNTVEASRALNISRPTLYKLLQDPNFPKFKIGNRTLIPAEGLREWVKQQAAKETRRGEATPQRAEMGAELDRGTTSHIQNTTTSGGGQTGIASLLSPGRENAIVRSMRSRAAEIEAVAAAVEQAVAK